MVTHYLVDGYNVLYHARHFAEPLRHGLEVGRDVLCDEIARFCVSTGARAKIVFDGRGRRVERMAHGGAAGCELIFSAGLQSADTLIERMVYQAEQRRSIVVVSGDQGIRGLCGALGAFTMTPNNFLATLNEALRLARAHWSAERRPQNIRRVSDRLDANALALLHALKDTLEK